MADVAGGGSLANWAAWHTSKIVPLLQQEADWPALEARIKGGVAINALVRELKDRPALATVNPRSLRRALFRFKASLPPEVLLGGIWAEKSRVVLKAVALLERGLDDLVDLERLYQQQRQRITLGRALENRTKMPLEGVRREMELAFEMRKAIFEAKQSLGLLPQRPVQVQQFPTDADGSGLPQDAEDTMSMIEGVRVLNALREIKRSLKHLHDGT